MKYEDAEMEIVYFSGDTFIVCLSGEDSGDGDSGGWGDMSGSNSVSNDY
ncbi:MAG: hypothetical protein LUE20_08325 [Oscillospiraceae bacterium]|nr:hypothetical protein [Oscillospiraceae bacterium]